jgi:hypothetical protein
MRPYPRRVVDFAETVCNYRFLGASRTVEYLWHFGEKFGIFRKPIETAFDLADESIKECLYSLQFFFKKEHISVDILKEEGINR